ncbi:DNA polymerase delta catalytic subunit [Elsinoe australis]|uniref:DNA polymerase delta catalytic subunit n=1 Tax=Elsinoe australis TaxID=40998 RepID=A0A2P7Z4H9_9PEZI|nr:DNA polymerase delta catalytic subunit [Elsinoe australis]
MANNEVATSTQDTACDKLKCQVDKIVEEWSQLIREIDDTNLTGWNTDIKFAQLKAKKAAHERKTQQARKKVDKLEKMLEKASTVKDKEKEWVDMPNVGGMNLNGGHQGSDSSDEDEEEFSDKDEGV